MMLVQDATTGYWKQTPSGRRLLTHAPQECEGRLCDVHNRRGDGVQITWPLNWREDRGIMEVVCPHGIGHPTPAQVQFMLSKDYHGNDRPIHGCDGCCHPDNGWGDSYMTIGWMPPTKENFS